MSQFFDLHTHTSLKTMLGGKDSSSRNSCWKIVKSKIPDALLGGIFGSQSSLAQLEKGNVKIAVTALYSLEKAFADNWLLKEVVTKIEKDLSKGYLQLIASDKISPYENLKNELEHINNAKKVKGSVHIVNYLTEINNNKLNLILATEGMHCFQNSYNISNIEETIGHIKDNFRAFIQEYRVLYTGLTHLTRGPICTHTYAMKLLKGEEFIPQGEGLTNAAKEIIDICYSGVGFNGKKTFIDIKHMGIVSRMQLYKYRTQKGYSNIPIVASHMAVTGRSFNNIKIASRHSSNEHENSFEVEHRRSFSDLSYTVAPSDPVDIDFNPWSLNLYDEEIIHIIDSGGIIGLILDKRVLGAIYTGSEKASEGIEYFSKESCDYLVANNHFNQSDTDDQNSESITIEIIKKENIGIAHLFANIMHIVKTFYIKYADTDQKFKAWDHICMGSDSDGLISTIAGYIDATDFEVLKGEMYEIIELSREGDLHKYFGTLETDILLSKLFYSNGAKFIDKHL